MNCKQTEELLPLYAGGDLENKRAASVAAHLKECPDCAQVADEYRGACQMTQQLTPPVFSADVFAKLHRNVFNEIEVQTTRASLSDFFFGWFHPRTTWAIASALVVAFAVLAIYLVANRQAGNESSQWPAPDAPSAPSTGLSRNSDTQKPRRLKPRKHSGRTGLLMAKVRDSPSMKIAPKQEESTQANPTEVNDSIEERPLRVEMQTRDPNIRIIWFAQPATKPTLPNSKGI